MLTTIWERYFLREALKIFGYFLAGFYGLYALIDYSNHAASFKHYHFTFVDILKFYGFEFISKMNVLIPFALLIACVKTLSSLNARNELVALMASGIKLKRLLLPFVFLGFFFTSFLYFTEEMLQPMAFKYNTKLDHSRAKAKIKKYAPIKRLILNDGSTFIYQDYDPLKKEFFDAYWIRSINDIYRMKYLYPYTKEPTGKLVEHFIRSPEGFLALKRSYIEKILPDMHFSQDQLMETLFDPETLSLSTLKQKLPSSGSIMSEKEAQLATTYFYKLALPWLALLAVIAPAPFCIRFERSRPLFLVYALSIFGLVSFYLVLDAAQVLGERQMFDPALSIWIPFSIFFALFGYRFLKL